jgi:erythronate-4-phosphate dehydrogenase
MIKIVADNKIPFLEGALEEVAKVAYVPGSEISRRHLLESDGLIIRTRTRCNRELLEGTSVRFIASATIGYDHIDTDYCRENGIRWTNAPGCNSSSVEQYIVSALLWLAVNRKLSLTGKTMGVIGVGNVGSKVAAAAGHLGMKVLLNDPPRERSEGSGDFVSLGALLADSDIISLHVPLNRGGPDNTLHMVGGEFMGQVKKGAVLINSSRGGVVDESALMGGIRGGILSDTILDVFGNEPDVSKEMLDLITLATPHIAGYSLDGKANGTTMSVRAMSRFFSLGLDQWSPVSVPAPETSELLADAADQDIFNLLWELYSQTYDIGADDLRLRNDPGRFEQLRGDYPFRREPRAYSVRLFQGDREIRTILESLGFDVLADHCM